MRRNLRRVECRNKKIVYEGGGGGLMFKRDLGFELFYHV